MFEAIEAIAGMVASMLELPVVGFLGRLVPAGSSEARQQVATAVGTGLDNLGSLCSQAGLDRWELLGLAVLSAITVYRKELSSNSVYNGGRVGKEKDTQHEVPTLDHVDGCPLAENQGSGRSTTAHCVQSQRIKTCICPRLRARQRQRASAARRLRTTMDERKLRRLVEGRMRSLNLPVHHLQQLRASVDASWSSFATAWEARRARGGGVKSARESGANATPADSDDFLMPECSHRSTHKAEASAREDESDACLECAALREAHLAATAILRNEDGTMGLLEADDMFATSALGALPGDSLTKALSFLPAQDLLTFAQVAAGAREAADSDLVWRNAWLSRFGSMWESDICQDAARRWHLHDWHPSSALPPQGWKVFFSEFEASWLEWVGAGQNSEASCLVGLHGRLYDITQFMHRHPGSPETLMDNAGADATEFFEDVGHSSVARDLTESIPSIAPRSSPRTAHGKHTRGTCILTSTSERMRQERIKARQGLQGAKESSVPFTPELDCGHCRATFVPFEPATPCGDAGSGRDRPSTCSHATGSLRVFYSPVRAEWGAFYSCCRKHVLPAC